MIEFWKYHGIGNDFIILDGMNGDPGLTAERIAYLCNRNYGVGSDGLIVIYPGVDGSDVTMRIFNADGSEAEMCGNGVRCLAKHVLDTGIVTTPDFTVSTGRGLLRAECTLDGEDKVSSVRIDMGTPILDPSAVPVAGKGDRVIDHTVTLDDTVVHINAVSMGNPHCVIFDDLTDADVERLGPSIESDVDLFPRKVNVGFASVVDGCIDLRVFERGVGWTLACGTGACAATVAAALNRLVPYDVPVRVRLPGGDLRITVESDLGHVYMEGPAVFVYKGYVDL